MLPIIDIAGVRAHDVSATAQAAATASRTNDSRGDNDGREVCA